MNTHSKVSLCLHLQQLFGRQAEFRQYFGNLTWLLGKSVGHSCHHGSALSAAALWEEESDIGVRDQTSYCPMKTAGVSETDKRVWVLNRAFKKKNPWVIKSIRHADEDGITWNQTWDLYWTSKLGTDSDTGMSSLLADNNFTVTYQLQPNSYNNRAKFGLIVVQFSIVTQRQSSQLVKSEWSRQICSRMF